MKTHIQILALVVASALIAVTVLSSQQASAVVVIGGKDFKKLTNQFQRDVLSLVASDPWGNAPDSERQRLLAMLFQDYEQETFRIFGLTPP